MGQARIGRDRAPAGHLEVEPAHGRVAGIERRGQAPRRARRTMPLANVGDLHRASLGGRSDYRFPRFACSRSIASNSALKLPTPKPREPWRSMISKKKVGRSWTGRVKIWRR